MTLTLDEWVEENGFLELQNDFMCHCSVYNVLEDKTLVRMCMISLRQALEDRQAGYIDWKAAFQDSQAECAKLKERLAKLSTELFNFTKRPL